MVGFFILANTIFHPTGHGDGLSVANATAEDANGGTAFMETVDKDPHMLSVNGQVVWDAALMFIALDVEQAYFGSIKGYLCPRSLLRPLKLVLLHTGIKIVPAGETAILSQSV